MLSWNLGHVLRLGGHPLCLLILALLRLLLLATVVSGLYFSLLI